MERWTKGRVGCEIWGLAFGGHASIFWCSFGLTAREHYLGIFSLSLVFHIVFFLGSFFIHNARFISFFRLKKYFSLIIFKFLKIYQFQICNHLIVSSGAPYNVVLWVGVTWGYPRNPNPVFFLNYVNDFFCC
jgi:hypothetical protein